MISTANSAAVTAAALIGEDIGAETRVLAVASRMSAQGSALALKANLTQSTGGIAGTAVGIVSLESNTGLSAVAVDLARCTGALGGTGTVHTDLSHLTCTYLLGTADVSAGTTVVLVIRQRNTRAAFRAPGERGRAARVTDTLIADLISVTGGEAVTAGLVGRIEINALLRVGAPGRSRAVAQSGAATLDALLVGSAFNTALATVARVLGGVSAQASLRVGSRGTAGQIAGAGASASRVDTLLRALTDLTATTTVLFGRGEVLTGLGRRTVGLVSYAFELADTLAAALHLIAFATADTAMVIILLQVNTGVGLLAEDFAGRAGRVT